MIDEWLKDLDKLYLCELVRGSAQSQEMEGSVSGGKNSWRVVILYGKKMNNNFITIIMIKICQDLSNLK